MLQAILVDDESKALESLLWELSKFHKDITVLNTFTNPNEAIDFIKHHHVDCVFLDIEMPTMDGFQFLNHLESQELAIVFTTAYNEYALRALKKEALDYLLKPIDSDDLKQAILKIKKSKGAQNLSAAKLEQILSNYNSTTTKKIKLNTDGKLIFLDKADILFVESEGNYSTLHLANSKQLVLTKKLKEVSQVLPTSHFFRIHNSYIVNLGKIKEFIKSENYIILESNHKIPISRQRKAEFLEKF
jgi:two-component system LytT family response regulator